MNNKSPAASAASLPKKKPAQRKGKGDASAEPGAEPGAERSLDLRAYTSDFFTLFGAEVTPLDHRAHGPLRVALQGDLAAHFGAAELGLAFQSVEAGSGHQLVAHGSRIFDTMQGWLDQRSALTVRRLPARTTGSEPLMRAVKPLNAGVANLKLAEQQEPLFAFHWRITYRADDKREELYTVALDADGVRLPLDGAAAGLPPLQTLLADSESAPVLAAPQSLRAAAQAEAPADPTPVDLFPADPSTPAPTQDSPTPADPTPADPALADPALADPDEAPAISPNGQRLPAMTQLVRLAEQARRYAVYHADLRCVEHEAEILPRLYKAVERLSNYYAQQIEELSGDSGEKAEALQADLARKVGEEVENHRLRVGVQLCGYAVIYRPLASADMTLSDGRRAARLRVLLDRYSGAVQLPTCHACGAPVSGAVLCRNGHVACDGCLRQCDACHDVLCAACGVAPCSSCGRQLCEGCGRSCWACGERACIEHLGRCPVCGDEVCDACRTPCAECGSLQCRSHLCIDAVARPEDGAAPRLICSRCAVRCPGCAQFSARMATCALSGQRFCANCVATCVDCGRTVGPGFFARDGRGVTWCRECAATCMTCGAIAEMGTPCKQCGRGTCRACALTCDECGETFCRDHAQKVAGCGHILCGRHALACAVGGEAVCPMCSEPCAICERTVCTQHLERCKWCAELYCSDCMCAGAEICTTCRDAVLAGNEVMIEREPAYADTSVRVVAPLFRWTKASNREVTVYCGTSMLMQILVTVHTASNGRLVVNSRRLGSADHKRVQKAQQAQWKQRAQRGQ